MTFLLDSLGLRVALGISDAKMSHASQILLPKSSPDAKSQRAYEICGLGPIPEQTQMEMPTGSAAEQQVPAQATVEPTEVRPKDKEQLDSARVQNPHEPEATYSVKGK